MVLNGICVLRIVVYFSQLLQHMILVERYGSSGVKTPVTDRQAPVPSQPDTRIPDTADINRDLRVKQGVIRNEPIGGQLPAPPSPEKEIRMQGPP